MNTTRLFTEEVLIQRLKDPEIVLATGTRFPASGAFINVGDYDRFMFLINVGAFVQSNTFQVQQAITINGTPKDVTGAVVVVSGTGDNKWYSIECDVSHLDMNNGYTFVTLLDTGGGAGDFADIFFLGLVPGKQPVTQGADKGSAVTLVG